MATYTMYCDLDDYRCPKREGELSPENARQLLLKFEKNIREFRPPDARRLADLAYETYLLQSARQAIHNRIWRP